MYPEQPFERGFLMSGTWDFMLGCVLEGCIASQSWSTSISIANLYLYTTYMCACFILFI